MVPSDDALAQKLLLIKACAIRDHSSISSYILEPLNACPNPGIKQNMYIWKCRMLAESSHVDDFHKWMQSSGGETGLTLTLKELK